MKNSITKVQIMNGSQNKNILLQPQQLSNVNDLASLKKIQRKLPDNFFEKVIEEELTLKRHFTIESLQSLVDLYSVFN